MKKLICLFLLIISIASAALFLFRAFPVIKNNREIQEKWDLILTTGKAVRPFSQYKEKVPVEQMDKDGLLKAAERIIMYWDEGQPDHDFGWTLTRDLHYYSVENGRKTIARTIPKGTKVQLADNGPSFYYVNGYGLTSFPTYSGNWRYVRCFLTSEEADEISITESADEAYYYIKTSELEALAKDFIQNALDTWASEEITEGMTKTEYARDLLIKTLFRIDDTLFSSGVYNSPNLYMTVFDTLNCLLLVCAALSLAAFVLLWQYPKKSG